MPSASPGSSSTVCSHVLALAHLPTGRRPRAHCPQCGRRLTLKLGAVRRHHAAHDAGHVCAAANPETALHINSKLAIAAALRDAAGPDATLAIVRQCAGGAATSGDCDKTLISEWAQGWDEVMVEYRVGDARRPDIVLRRRGAAIGAIEIVVSNAVTAEKAIALAELDLPWIEVRADETIFTPNGWTPRDPLAVVRTSDEAEWRCDTHRALHAAARQAREARASEQDEAARHASVLLAARVVDVYHAGGARDRFIYRVSERLTDGQAHTMQLKRGGVEVAAVAMAGGVDERRRAWPLIRAAFDADVEHFARDEHSFVDSPMRWAREGAAENIVEEALTDRVGRDPTPLATRFPRRWFYAKEQQRWFVPAEMRDVRWDRPADDAFAAHPAWSGAYASVREHPAPEGSWSTPVFASRPTASMFRASVRSTAPADGGWCAHGRRVDRARERTAVHRRDRTGRDRRGDRCTRRTTLGRGRRRRVAFASARLERSARRASLGAIGTRLARCGAASSSMASACSPPINSPAPWPRVIEG